MNKTFESLMLGAIEKQFLARFAGEIQLERYHLQNEIIDRVRVTAQELFEIDRPTCPDPQARIILKLCCLSLASYRILVTEIHNPQIGYSIVKNTIGKLYERFAKFMFRPLLWLVRDPVKVISTIDWKKLSS